MQGYTIKKASHWHLQGFNNIFTMLWWFNFDCQPHWIKNIRWCIRQILEISVIVFPEAIGSWGLILMNDKTSEGIIISSHYWEKVVKGKRWDFTGISTLLGVYRGAGSHPGTLVIPFLDFLTVTKQTASYVTHSHCHVLTKHLKPRHHWLNILKP